MKLPAFPSAIAAPLLALAVPVPQAAFAFSLPAPQCLDPSTTAAAPAFAVLPERSRLETMRMQQETGVIAPQPAVEPVTVAAPCTAVVKPFAQQIEQDVPTTDRPDVFGSIALPVSHTPLDAKWRAAYKGRLSVRSGPWASLIRTVSREGRAEQLHSINQWVNARVRFTDDRRGGDNWSGASETLRRGRGDCEDYAIAKMKLLEAAGVARADMYLVIANDLARRADHALLVVRLDDRLMVLDSSTDQLLDAELVSDYRPIFSYGANSAWVHGYAEKPVQIAAAF